MGKLGINGGLPLRTEAWPKWPVSGESERQKLLETLDGGQWGTLGPQTAAFESAWARYIGVKRAQTVTNGTAALEVILRALGIGPGDEVLIPPYTFIATATAVLMAGAIPVFVDVDPSTNAMDAGAAAEAFTDRTRAIMPVHIAGIPADLDALVELANQKGCWLIEDAAQAHGSEWRGRKLGSFGAAGSFSFQLSKNLSAGEGGAITTDDEELADKCWTIHHIGRKKDGPWYGHYALSGNYRLTDFQAAVLLGGLERLDEQIDRREASASLLNRELASIDGISVFPRDERATRITHHLYMFHYDAASFGAASKQAFVDALAAEGIPAHSGYTPIQKQPLFASEEVRRITGGIDYASLRLPAAETACEQTVWILQNALLADEDAVMDIVRAISKIRGHYKELEAVNA